MAPATAAPGSAPQIVDSLHPCDILLGRGAPIVNYVGNVAFRELVSSRKDEYVNTISHQVKDNIAREIVDEIGAQDGRFLRRIETPEEAIRLGLPPNEKVWIVADDDVAIEKVKQALRDKIAANAKATAAEAANPGAPVASRKRSRSTPSSSPSRASRASKRPDPEIRPSAASSLSSLEQPVPSTLPVQETFSFLPASSLSQPQVQAVPQQAHATNFQTQAAPAPPPLQADSPFLSLLQQQQLQPAQSARDPAFYLASLLSPNGGQQAPPPNAVSSAVGQPTNLTLLALQQLERNRMQDANSLARLQSLEVLRRLELTRGAQEHQGAASLHPILQLQRLEMARAEESRRITLQQLELARAEEESRRASMTYVAALQRLEVARHRDGSTRNDRAGPQLGDLSLDTLQQLGFAQLDESSRLAALEVLRERQRQQEIQQLLASVAPRVATAATPMGSSATGLPLATTPSVLESFADLAEQYGASVALPREAALPSSVATTLSSLTPGQAATATTLVPTGQAYVAPENNESSPSSTSTNEQDRKPRAKTNDERNTDG